MHIKKKISALSLPRNAGRTLILGKLYIHTTIRCHIHSVLTFAMDPQTSYPFCQDETGNRQKHRHG